MVDAPRTFLVKELGRDVAVFSIRVLENFKPGSVLMTVSWVRVEEGWRLAWLLCVLKVVIKIFDKLL